MIDQDRRRLAATVAGWGLAALGAGIGQASGLTGLLAPARAARAAASNHWTSPRLESARQLGRQQAAGAPRSVNQRIDLDQTQALRRYRFDPNFLLLEPGAELRFLNSLNQHTVTSVEGMRPKEAEGFSIQFQKEAYLRFQWQGVYGIKCRAHARFGMVTLVVVGRPDGNLNAARYRGLRQRGLAGRAFEALFTQLDQHFST